MPGKAAPPGSTEPMPAIAPPTGGRPRTLGGAAWAEERKPVYRKR